LLVQIYFIGITDIIKTEQQHFYNRIQKQLKVFVLNEPTIGLIVILYCRIKFIQVAL